MIFAIHMMGLSSILGSINIIATITQYAAPRHEINRYADVLLGLVDYRFFIDWVLCRY